MAIQKEFLLRYREAGHVRFQVPQRVCKPEIAKLTVAKIANIEGVYKVNLYRNQNKLSIRYHESVCRFHDLISLLNDVLADLELLGYFKDKSAATLPEKKPHVLKQRLKNSRIKLWFSDKIQVAKETLQAAKIIGKASVKGRNALIKNPEKAVIDFLNDVLVLYLIKLHWNRITQQWLLKPITYRYEWMAVFYLFFLFVRARKPK